MKDKLESLIAVYKPMEPGLPGEKSTAITIPAVSKITTETSAVEYRVI